MPAKKPSAPRKLRALKGVRVVSLALNLPGPAALMRCCAMGATCVKLEPPPPAGSVAGTTADPMGVYNRGAYDVMHQGVRVAVADLKTEAGQKVLHRELAKADVLLTSFRPSALAKLGLEVERSAQAPPAALAGGNRGCTRRAGRRARSRSDLHGRKRSGDRHRLAPTLYADMGGSLMASQKPYCKARLLQLAKGQGVRLEIALSEAANYLALPRSWGLTTPGAAVGGGHAGYRVFACKDGRVALAALEPHFAKALAQEAGLAKSNIMAMFMPESHTAIAKWCAGLTRSELEAVGTARDIPLFTLA